MQLSALLILIKLGHSLSKISFQHSSKILLLVSPVIFHFKCNFNFYTRSSFHRYICYSTLFIKLTIIRFLNYELCTSLSTFLGMLQIMLMRAYIYISVCKILNFCLGQCLRTASIHFYKNLLHLLIRQMLYKFFQII
jgi:hypothetical protein